ncbi:Fis family transcriptional regulator [Calothrix sp. NIES-4071]|nr:Fis family transcriptional regulator [Calothrix sp. NIES-4071]BAZ58163.1 Fis family transcriptional regulator [Calothrix sp. NIES-4105]
MGSKINALFVVLFIAVATPATLIPTSGEATQVSPQTPTVRKAKASRLFKQGINQYQSNKYRAALQSWAQAIAIYRETKKPTSLPSK